MESTSVNDPAVDQAVIIDEIETPSTPETSKDELNTSGSTIESPRTLKPVLGKLQAKKRLMAFANKFSTIPKVHKFKNKVDKVIKSK